MADQLDRVQEIARRGEIDPESLTDDEIRELCVAALEDLGLAVEPQIDSAN